MYGVDLTTEMLEIATRNAANTCAEGRTGTCSFLQSAIDDGAALEGVIPANSAHVVISNGVFNLTADKAAAFASAFRVCKPGGKFLLFDVMKCPLPAEQVAAA